GIITSLTAPDRSHRTMNVVLGHDRLEPYLDNRPYFGAIVGRYANRIGGARFLLDGRQVQLRPNEGRNQLHGGVNGFHQQLWDATSPEDGEAERIVLARTSPDGEEGYPGTLRATVSYTVTRNDTVRIEYTAITDAATVV